MMLCRLFILHAMPNESIEYEISLSNEATLSQSDLIWMFFISYDVWECYFCFQDAKHNCLYFTFQRCSFKKNMATDLDHD